MNIKPPIDEETLAAANWIAKLVKGGTLYSSIAEKMRVNERSLALFAMDPSYRLGPDTLGRVIWFYRQEVKGERQNFDNTGAIVDADGNPYGALNKS